MPDPFGAIVRSEFPPLVLIVVPESERLLVPNDAVAIADAHGLTGAQIRGFLNTDAIPANALALAVNDHIIAQSRMNAEQANQIISNIIFNAKLDGVAGSDAWLKATDASWDGLRADLMKVAYSKDALAAKYSKTGTATNAQSATTS